MSNDELSTRITAAMFFICSFCAQNEITRFLCFIVFLWMALTPAVKLLWARLLSRLKLDSQKP